MEQVKPPLAELLNRDFNDMVRSMACKCARPFSNHPLITVSDLESEGMLAALKAYERFDPDKGSFSTYAFTFVDRAMKLYVLKHRFRLSASNKDLRNNFAEVQEANSGMMNVDTVEIAHTPVMPIGIDLEEFFLRGFDDSQREIARDRFVHGMGITDLANKHGLSTSGIDRVLTSLRAKLQVRGRVYENHQEDM